VLKIKKISIVFAFLVFIAGVVLKNVYADNLTPTPTPSNRGQQIKDRRASQAARLSDLRKSIIQKFFDQMVKRIEAAIERLNKLISRIESRIVKLKGEGKDTASIESQVNDAKIKLASAKTKLQDAKTALDGVLSSNNPKDAFKQVRVKIQDVAKDLREVHKILVHLVGDIKGLRVGQTGSPTVTIIPSLTPTPTP